MHGHHGLMLTKHESSCAWCKTLFISRSCCYKRNTLLHNSKSDIPLFTYKVTNVGSRVMASVYRSAAGPYLPLLKRVLPTVRWHQPLNASARVACSAIMASAHKAGMHVLDCCHYDSHQNTSIQAYGVPSAFSCSAAQRCPGVGPMCTCCFPVWAEDDGPGSTTAGWRQPQQLLKKAIVIYCRTKPLRI